MPHRRTSTLPDHVDALVVGAGIAGISAAHHLASLPSTTFAVLEAREELGGTWSFFRYPGLRSDSDMATYGYGFQPWTSPLAIAQAPDILDYLRKTVTDEGLDRHIRFGHKVSAASFDSSTGLWTVDVVHDDTETRVTARFLFLGAGYYDYDTAFTPDFDGVEDFRGIVVHPQFWPADLEYAGKRVVVIGSGATAITLIPSMAPSTEHITMLQRSPSYVLSIPATDPLARVLGKVLGPRRAHGYVRRKNIWMNRSLYKWSKRAPKLVRRFLLIQTRLQLPRGFDVATHFAPSYNPWEQRLCVVPDGDLFKAISAGDASVVTDHVERFTPTGIRLRSGRHLDADIIVTATGLNMLPFGGIPIRVDGEAADLSQRFAFKSMMVSGIPNLAYAIGYSNISATLKFDLVAEHFSRLIRFMDTHGYDTVTPTPTNPRMSRRPILELSSGYVQRRIDAFPHAGDEEPWTVEQAYEKDVERLRTAPVDDPQLLFSRVPAPSAVREQRLPC
ncbi:NAD(P)/FAD-dependent oxidoreductase [Nocardioides maradonensis]